jgi:hypothetical protein
MSSFWRGVLRAAPADSAISWESDREDQFYIRCTADPAKAEKQTRSKWPRALRYAAAYNASSEALDQFIRRKGGIIECAARFSRWLGRGAPSRTAG